MCLYQHGIDPQLQTVFEVQPEHVWRTLDNMKADAIVMERFIAYPRPKMDLTPVEVIGVIKEWCRQRDASLIQQTASQVKAFYTDDRLKNEGRFEKGMPHANDAMRHLMYYLTFKEKAPTHPVHGGTRLKTLRGY